MLGPSMYVLLLFAPYILWVYILTNIFLFNLSLHLQIRDHTWQEGISLPYVMSLYLNSLTFQLRMTMEWRVSESFLDKVEIWVGVSKINKFHKLHIEAITDIGSYLTTQHWTRKQGTTADIVDIEVKPNWAPTLKATTFYQSAEVMPATWKHRTWENRW